MKDPDCFLNNTVNTIATPNALISLLKPLYSNRNSFTLRVCSPTAMSSLETLPPQGRAWPWEFAPPGALIHTEKPSPRPPCKFQHHIHGAGLPAPSRARDRTQSADPLQVIWSTHALGKAQRPPHQDGRAMMGPLFSRTITASHGGLQLLEIQSKL